MTRQNSRSGPPRPVLAALALALGLVLAGQAGAATKGTPARSVGNSENPSCDGGLPAPTLVSIAAGKATMVNLDERIVRRTLGDPEIVDGRMVSPQVLYLVAGRIGSTNAILQGSSGRCVVLEIVVGIDTSAVLGTIRELMPTEAGIQVSAAADSLVLSGTASSAMAAERAVAIANAYARAAYQQGLDARRGGNQQDQEADAGGAPLLARVVNMMSISASHQVMLEVKVAEVSKTLLDKLGSSFNASRNNGSFTYQLLTDFLLGGTTGGAIGATKNASNNLLLEAEKRDGLVRMLAEPNVMAISGQEGSFLAGGKILIPVAQDERAGRTVVTLEEKEFGVGLKFTPTVLGDGRINLQVAPEVSELSREGVGISNSLGGNAVFPLITTRRAATTVQLFDGQSFAIGGLLKSSSASNIKGLPVLGELPVLGALFRSTDYQAEKTELVFIVTPRLVRPLPPDYTLPTDRIGETDRGALMLHGQLDSRPQGAATPDHPGMELK